jgi:hypothetical protein
LPWHCNEAFSQSDRHRDYPHSIDCDGVACARAVREFGEVAGGRALTGIPGNRSYGSALRRAFPWTNWQVLRRSFAMRLKKKGADVKDAQALMPHSKASTFIPKTHAESRTKW